MHEAARPRPRLNLALQGGGSHGALTWGVLDALLEDGQWQFDGVSGTSAGAMNAVALAHGFAQAAQQHPFGQPVGHPGQQQQGPDHGDVVGPWIRLQGFLQRIQCFVHDVKSPGRWARCRAGNGAFSQAPYHVDL